MNINVASPAVDADPEAAAWYAEARPADAHADTLLWNRDLCARGERGHVDFPRLRDAGVRLQAFTIPTRGYPLLDGTRAFCAIAGWPRAARRSPFDRAMYQIERLHDACARCGGVAAPARTAAELRANLAAGRLSAVLGVEGAFPLEGDLSRLQQLWDGGVRFLGPAHLIPNEYISCSYWLYRDRGLSALGRELIKEMARLRMAVDLAHASPRALDELLALGAGAGFVFTSHTGAAGATPHWRNLSDRHIQQIAERGGVIAMILARMYLGGPGLADFARHAAHAAKIAGAGSVAIGSDFDGFVKLPREMRDARDFAKCAPALKAAGFGKHETQAILGENLINFFERALPPV